MSDDQRAPERSSDTVTAVERATQVLTLFAQSDQDTLGVTEIAEMLDLSKAVVHRILTTLRESRFVDVDPDSRRYSLGPASLALGLSYLERLDVRKLARPEMRRLSEETGETATLSIPTDGHRIYIEQVTPRREVKMTVQLGRPFPLHAGSSSKALLAFMDEADQERYIESSDLQALTKSTITDPDRLRVELAKIRRKGFAKSLGERQPGAASVAAPILDHEGRPVASMSICGPVERFAPRADEAAALLLDSVRKLSEQLGFRGGDSGTV
jgi:DNA-binding IclR family transcriptional regulator